jgi:hypothetical protein
MPRRRVEQQGMLLDERTGERFLDRETMVDVDGGDIAGQEVALFSNASELGAISPTVLGYRSIEFIGSDLDVLPAEREERRVAALVFVDDIWIESDLELLLRGRHAISSVMGSRFDVLC